MSKIPLLLGSRVLLNQWRKRRCQQPHISDAHVHIKEEVKVQPGTELKAKLSTEGLNLNIW